MATSTTLFDLGSDVIIPEVEPKARGDSIESAATDDSWELDYDTSWALGNTSADDKPTELVASGVIGAEYLNMKQASSSKSISKLALFNQKVDPYHGKSVDPKCVREPAKQTFNIMVVGESGLGKTTLLESFFKSFKDDEATFALFERKETEVVIETRKRINDMQSRYNICEREMKAAAEKMQYDEANAKREELLELDMGIREMSEHLKELSKMDEQKRGELHLLRSKARALKIEMKRAADQLKYARAHERRIQAELVEAECRQVQEELKLMRTHEEILEEEKQEKHHGELAINAPTVRVQKFEPFRISVGRHELEVNLIDTPGYGDSINASDSFEVITEYVKEMMAERATAEMASKRDLTRLNNEDTLVHCCLYFIAPHRFKHMDIAFMKALHDYVNIVPIIAKSDTMTTKEKEEFKMHVRDALRREGVQTFDFDQNVIRQMEQQDKTEYKAPWAVIGSTDSHIDNGSTVFLRKYPWGNALSSDPNHSDLPALRNLIMWTGQWADLKAETRLKYEGYRKEMRLNRLPSFLPSKQKLRLALGSFMLALALAGLLYTVTALAVHSFSCSADLDQRDREVSQIRQHVQVQDGMIDSLLGEKVNRQRLYQLHVTELQQQVDSQQQQVTELHARINNTLVKDGVRKVQGLFTGIGRLAQDMVKDMKSTPLGHSTVEMSPVG